MATQKSNKIPTFDYLRKSTKGEETDRHGRKRERQEKSIAQQRQELDKLGLPREVIDAGYDGVEIVPGDFTDEGVSGWKLGSKRPGFQRMIDAIKQHPAPDKLIRVDNIDRFSRADIDDTLAVGRELKAAGVKWILAAAQGIFRIGSGNDLVEHMKFAFAASASHEYSRQLGRRVALARRNQAAAGKRPSAAPPYAMASDDTGDLVPGDAAQVATLRQMFDWFTHGKSLRWIALELNAKGTPAPQCETWYAETVKKLLSQRAYAGDLAFGVRPCGQFFRTGHGGDVVAADEYENNGGPAITHEGKYEAIIDRALFDNAQARLASFKTGRKPRHDGYALSRVLVCDHCGKSMYGTTINGRTVVYRCGSQLRNGECRQFQIRESVILPGLMRMLGEEIDAMAAATLIPKPPAPTARTDTTKCIATLQKRIDKATSNLLFVSDARTRQDLDAMISAMRDELERLNAEQSEPAEDDSAAVGQLQEWWHEINRQLVQIVVDANSLLAEQLFPEMAALAKQPAPWHWWAEALTGNKPSAVFLAEFDRRALNEALHGLGCEVRLRFRTEPWGKRQIHVVDRGRVRLGQQTGDLVPSVNHTLPCIS
jgi:DNA invertase Pin-like site-specific DNA recombinase